MPSWTHDVEQVNPVRLFRTLKTSSPLGRFHARNAYQTPAPYRRQWQWSYELADEQIKNDFETLFADTKWGAIPFDWTTPEGEAVQVQFLGRSLEAVGRYTFKIQTTVEEFVFS